MSPQFPPQISVEKRIGFRTCSTTRSRQPSGSFQLNQPIPNPIRERTVNVNSFHKKPSDTLGQPVGETRRTQTRSFDDNQNVNVEMAHESTRRFVVEYQIAWVELRLVWLFRLVVWGPLGSSLSDNVSRLRVRPAFSQKVETLDFFFFCGDVFGVDTAGINFDLSDSPQSSFPGRSS